MVPSAGHLVFSNLVTRCVVCVCVSEGRQVCGGPARIKNERSVCCVRCPRPVCRLALLRLCVFCLPEMKYDPPCNLVQP